MDRDILNDLSREDAELLREATAHLLIAERLIARAQGKAKNPDLVNALDTASSACAQARDDLEPDVIRYMTEREEGKPRRRYGSEHRLTGNQLLGREGSW